MAEITLMKVLILNWRDIKHPLAGGAEISLFEHAKYWKNKGAEVDWISSAYNNSSEYENIEGINVTRFGSQHSVHLKTFFNYLFGKFRNYDIVVDCFHFLPYFSPLYFKGSKLFALINEPAKEAWFKNIFFPANLIGYLLEPLFFIPYKRVVFITGSNSIASELPAYGIKKNKIYIVSHGVNIKKPKKIMAKEKFPALIYLSQISPDKGIEDAVKAFSLIQRKISNARMWVVGKERDKTYLAKIKKLVEDLKLDSNINFYGFVSEERKFELLSKSWILIHPSAREGWGLNVIEANSVSVPAVGYDVSGLKDSIQNGKTGILVERNYKELADGVIKLINDKKTYKAMSEKAKGWSRKFSWEESCKKSWKILNS